MRRTGVHLGLVVLAALGIRSYMVAYHAHEGGFSRASYLAPCYLLAAGYGYQRAAGGAWQGDVEFVDRLEAYSLELAKKGAQIDAQHRPPIDPERLRPLHFRAPGYIGFLYVVYRVLGEPLATWIVVLQAIVSSLYPVVVYLIVMRLFAQPGVALASAWLTALHPPLAVLAAGRLPDCLALGLLLLAILCWVHAAKAPSYRWMFVAGLLLTANAYFRSNALYLWVFMGLALFVVQRGWVRPALSTAILAGVLYAGLFPWALWNYRVSGRWIWGSTAVGRSLAYFVGMHPNTLGLRDDDGFIMEYAQDHGFESDSTPEADAWFRHLIKRYYVENPGRFVKATLRNLPWAVAPPFQTGLVSLATDRVAHTFTYYKNEEGLTPFQVLIRHPSHVLANYGERMLVMMVSAAANVSMLWLLVRRRGGRGDVLLLMTLPWYYILVHSLGGFVHSMPRYLAPMIPFQMIALALTASELRAWWRKEPPGTAVAPSKNVR